MSSIFKPTRIEWISFWILMPVISIAASFLLYGELFFQSLRVMIGSFAAVYLIGFISWYLHILSMHVLAVLMPDLSQTVPRLILLVLVHFLLISLTMFTYFYGFDAVHYLGYKVNRENFRVGIWVGLFLTMIATSLWQVEYIFLKWKSSLSEKELIEQQRLVQEFDNLKKQINPHFLFNNLNILSSLITEDPVKAEYFLNELSRVYRYLLKGSEDGLTSLRAELDFIQSYFALLKIRHSDTIQMKLGIADEYMAAQLPSFSLQLLIENAVKHNVATKVSPLMIQLCTTAGGQLCISNNLQKKKGNILSNKVGLSTITENYRLLLNAEITVLELEQEFRVILPLIKKEIS